MISENLFSAITEHRETISRVVCRLDELGWAFRLSGNVMMHQELVKMANTLTSSEFNLNEAYHQSVSDAANAAEKNSRLFLDTAIACDSYVRTV